MVRLQPRLCYRALLVIAGGGENSSKLSVTSARRMSSTPPASYKTLKDRAICEVEIKRSKFIAIAEPITDERSAYSFLSEVKDLRATHNCWAYKLGDQYRCNDDGEPSGTAGKPIHSAIISSGVDMVVVVVIRYFGGIKLGTGGLVRAYSGVALECLKGAETHIVKPKVTIGMEVSFDLLGSIYHQLQYFHVKDIEQDYDTGKDGFVMLSFRVDYEKIVDLENAINSTCSRKIEFYKR